MNIIRTCRNLILVPILLLPQLASAAIYVKISGVDGDVQVDGYKNWIEVISINESISRAVNTGSGASRDFANVVLSDISVSRQIDSTSPELRNALASGKVYTDVDIHITRDADGDRGSGVYFKYKLEDVLITSINTSGDASTSIINENISMNFTKVTWTYIPQDTKGGAGTPKEATYDVQSGKTN